MLQRRARRWPYISLEEVKRFGRGETSETVWHDALANPMLVTSGKLAGTPMKFRFEDGLVWSYDFLDERHLRWETCDGRKGEEIYNASPAPGYENFLFLHHYCSLEIPGCADLMIDFDTGYAVLFDASLGLPANPREVRRTIRFGVIEGYPIDPRAEKPHFTNDLTGKAIRWCRPGARTGGIKYIFSSCCYLTYVMRFPDGTCWMATNPCDYIKFRDDLYLCSTVEERQAGVELIMLMNLTLCTDVQTEFGIGVPREGESRLETAMHSGRQGIWDTWETDLFTDSAAGQAAK